MAEVEPRVYVAACAYLRGGRPLPEVCRDFGLGDRLGEVLDEVAKLREVGVSG